MIYRYRRITDQRQSKHQSGVFAVDMGNYTRLHVFGGYYFGHVAAEWEESRIAIKLDDFTLKHLPEAITQWAVSPTMSTTLTSPDVTDEAELHQYFRHLMGWNSEWQP
ncbi:MAG: hypothetical protein BWK73_13970 [Thiothrix lacustris]|uniref:Uncharacterized protein n=1 Tax=Thiothrix lacustris TaxID=525917 RepID=A0A1Y1QSG4_9GAMM|nr:MAG: hypothetical protein BWK73_13970 [Thiothrix lacustris]